MDKREMPEEPKYEGRDIIYKGENYGTDSDDALVDYALDLRALLAEREKEIAAAQQELRQIDMALGSRPALDGVDGRIAKISLALRIAGTNDPKGALAEAEKEIFAARNAAINAGFNGGDLGETIAVLAKMHKALLVENRALLKDAELSEKLLRECRALIGKMPLLKGDIDTLCRIDAALDGARHAQPQDNAEAK